MTTAFTKLTANIIKEGNGHIANFQKRFAENPAYALEYTDVYKAAAEIELAKGVQAMVESFVTGYKGTLSEDDMRTWEAQVIRDFTRKLLREGQYVPSSSSATSNLIDQYRRAAIASFIDRYEYYKS